MDDALSRIWQEIVARPDGSLALRFYLQPLVSTALALRDGLKDARRGEPPYFWSLVTDPQHRRDRLHHGWRSVGKIFVIALALDVIYQFLVLGGLRPLEGLVVAVALALLPYLLLRGPFNRIATLVRRSQRAGAATRGP